MKSILVFVISLSSTAGLYAATIVAGCVTDANGKAVAGAKVFAEPERGDKTYRSETRKSDGCYEMKIAKDGVYGVGVRDARFAADGPVQRFITVSGLDLPNTDLSTDVPNAKLLAQRLTDAVLSASEGFARVRKGVLGGDVPVITAEVPSGFGNCMLQSSNDQNGATAMWWCTTGGGFGGIRDEKAAQAMFESIRDSITTALGTVGQLRYSSVKAADGHCYDCVDRAVWASPINGVVALGQTKDKKRNALVLWVAYNSPMTEQGCASIQKNEEPNVDVAKYDSVADAMRAEYARQVNAAFKAELRNLFGAAVGGPGFIASAQQSGVAGGSVVSPNACLSGPRKPSAGARPDNPQHLADTIQPKTSPPNDDGPLTSRVTTEGTAERRGDALMSQKLYSEAIEAYKDGVQSDPVLLNKIGIAYHQMVNLGMAKEYYERAIEAKHEYAEAINNLGTVYYALKEYRSAIKEYTKALQYKPEAESASIFSNMGTAYFALKDYKNATAAYEKARSYDPGMKLPVGFEKN